MLLDVESGDTTASKGSLAQDPQDVGLSMDAYPSVRGGGPVHHGGPFGSTCSLTSLRSGHNMRTDATPTA